MTPTLTKFEVASRGHRSTMPQLLVSRRTLVFNQSATFTFNFAEDQWYELYADKETLVIGIKLVPKRTAASYSMKVSKSRVQSRLHCTRFINYLGIADSAKYELQWHQEQKLIVGIPAVDQQRKQDVESSGDEKFFSRGDE